MRAEFTPDNHYAGLLAQAKALFRITQSQEAIISTLRSKLTELESQLAMVGTAEIEAQRAANEQLTNEVEQLCTALMYTADQMKLLADMIEHHREESIVSTEPEQIALCWLAEFDDKFSRVTNAVRNNLINAGKSQAEAIPGFIREMGERLRTQDNRITADPLFCVFEKDYVVAEEGYGHDRINEESNQGLEKDNYGNTLSWKATPDYGLIEISLNGEELVSWCYEDEPESVFNEFFTVWKKAQEAAREQQ